MQNAETTIPQSKKHADDSSSDAILVGRPPVSAPPRVADYEELDKKAIDILVDSLKYVATSSGIIIAVYAQMLREYLKMPTLSAKPAAQTLLFAPLMLWFTAIVGTVLGIFPREYRAATDADKERAVRDLRRVKVFWVRLVLIFFLLGFVGLLYVTAAQIWTLYPFR